MVKKEKGILCTCDKNKGNKTLKAEVVRDVIEFYQNNDNNCMCPGKKDSITVQNKDGENKKHQKHLVLSNLKELYASWKDSSRSKNRILCLC